MLKPITSNVFRNYLEKKLVKSSQFADDSTAVATSTIVQSCMLRNVENSFHVDKNNAMQ